MNDDLEFRVHVLERAVLALNVALAAQSCQAQEDFANLKQRGEWVHHIAMRYIDGVLESAPADVGAKHQAGRDRISDALKILLVAPLDESARLYALEVAPPASGRVQ